MKSMTGFGRAAISEDNFTITVELKSVNNRFLDINLRLGSELQAVENVIKKLISNRLTRGRVEVNLQYDRNDAVEYELNRPLISGFLTAMTEMRNDFKLAGEPDINVIARLPNVVNIRKEQPSPQFIDAVESAFALALGELEIMREREGELLKTDIVSRLAELESRVPKIEAAASVVADEYSARLTKRINDMLERSESQVEVDQGRLAQEVAYLADRADISEEITRLRSHIEHFRGILAEKADVGKRLDFLTQELNREANTIASKTNNMTIKEHALAIKSEIEKIREQIQNVE